MLNDTADWEQRDKKPLICATECDGNGALTMQLMHHLTGTPVLFADLRHYHEQEDLYDLVNSGQHAPWFAKRSRDFRRNWRECHIRPASEFYFRGGGGSVQSYAAPAPKVTFGRIVRRNGRFVMHVFTGAFVALAACEGGAAREADDVRVAARFRALRPAAGHAAGPLQQQPHSRDHRRPRSRLGRGGRVSGDRAGGAVVGEARASPLGPRPVNAGDDQCTIMTAQWA